MQVTQTESFLRSGNKDVSEEILIEKDYISQVACYE